MITSHVLIKGVENYITNIHTTHALIHTQPQLFYITVIKIMIYTLKYNITEYRVIILSNILEVNNVF